MGADLDRAVSLELELQLGEGALGFAAAGVSAYRHGDVGEYNVGAGRAILERDGSRDGDGLVFGSSVEQPLNRRLDRECRRAFTFEQTVELRLLDACEKNRRGEKRDTDQHRPGRDVSPLPTLTAL